MDSGLADAILLIHFAYVLFVVMGLVVIWVGFFLNWRVVRNFWFRLAHLLAMGYVVGESLMGVNCPLTLWEDQLRFKAGHGQVLQGSFIEYWVHRVMYYDASAETFGVVYVVFFAVMLLSLWIVKPQWPKWFRPHG